MKSKTLIRNINRELALGINTETMSQSAICNILAKEFGVWNSRLQLSTDSKKRQTIELKMNLICDARVEYCQQKPIIFGGKTSIQNLDAPLAPWKLSRRAIKAIQSHGYDIDYFDNWDIRCYALDDKNRINPQFLGLVDSEQRTNLYDVLFDTYGQPRIKVDPSQYVEDGGNLIKEPVTRGKFEGKLQPVLREKEIFSLLKYHS